MNVGILKIVAQLLLIVCGMKSYSFRFLLASASLSTALFTGACSSEQNQEEACTQLGEFLSQCQGAECDTQDVRDEKAACEIYYGDRADYQSPYDQEIYLAHQAHYEGGSCASVQDRYWLHGGSISTSELLKVWGEGTQLQVNDAVFAVGNDNSAYELYTQAYPNTSYASSTADILKTYDANIGKEILNVTLRRHVETTYSTPSAPESACAFSISGDDTRYFQCLAEDCTVYWYPNYE